MWTRVSAFIILFFFLMSPAVLAQSYPHVPAGHSHSGPICWGYATARAFGHDWNHSVCPASNLYTDHISEIHFMKDQTFSYGEIENYDIIDFYKTAGYPGWNGGAVQHVAYVRDKGYNSPYTTPDFHWESNHAIDAVMHGRTHGGYVQIFQEWKKNGSSTTIQKAGTITIDWNSGTPTFEANFKNEYNVTFRNQFACVSGYPGTNDAFNRTNCRFYWAWHFGVSLRLQKRSHLAISKES